jgi:CheY-like chemotaxis protein
MRKKIRMLIVEDNEDERLFIKEGFLQSNLYEIVGEAEDGDEMLKLLQDLSFPRPDLILSDLNMLGRNGYEVIMDIKTNSALSHIPIIILTTAPLVPYAERCKKMGACAYYTKPDTFLEYKEFAETIYDDVEKCLENDKLEFAAIWKLKGPFQDVLNACLSQGDFRPIWANSMQKKKLRDYNQYKCYSLGAVAFLFSQVSFFYFRRFVLMKHQIF